MSKNTTKENIFNQALRMFNEQGIEYVGMREIAKELDIRVGNITYYFPTKDDIVAAIVTELADANNTILEAGDDLSMSTFLQMYSETSSNQFKYRCLFVSFVYLMEHNPKVKEVYIPNQEKRYKTIRKNLKLLMQNGYMDASLNDRTLDFLVSSISLMSRFWLSEGRLRFNDAGKRTLFKHYLELFALHLHPYATKQGRRDIDRFIDDL